MPSNLIYSMVQDDKGFLWIGTDNGVTRFDGKYFKVFTTDDGLPDNEILEVRKEKNGTIWINTFKQGPLYFDEAVNRFVDPLRGLNIKKDFIKMVLHVRILEEGGIVFYSGDNELVFKNRKYVQLPYKTAFSYPDGKNRAFLYTEQRSKNGRFSNYVYYKNGNRFDSVLLYSPPNNDTYCVKFLKDDKLYLLFRDGKLYTVEFDKAASKFKTHLIVINDELVWFRLTDNRINITSTTGKVFVYDRAELSEKYSIGEKDFSNCILEDDDKNIWIGTLNKGLRLYKDNHIKLIKTSSGIDDNFMSILAAKNGNIYAGNYYGQIVEIQKNRGERVFRPFGSAKQIWIRSIISPNAKKIFAVTEQALLVDFKRKVKVGNGSLLVRMKDITSLNDSILIAGGVHPNGGLFKIDSRTEKATPLNSGLMRISNVESFGKRFVYCGTNEGLYKYDYAIDSVVNDFKNTPFSDERILEVHRTAEGLIVVATATKGIYILRDDKIIARLDNERLINNAVMDIASTPHHSFWISTRAGLSRVRYKLLGNNFSYETSSFSMTEGLPANIISDLSYRNDTIFLATENGVAFVPEQIESHGNIIKTFLTGIRINHLPIPLRKDNKYTLDYNQRALLLELAGVDLVGHLKRLQYTFDKEKGWINLNSDDLSLELGKGNHRLHIRAVDVNGNGQHPETVIEFDILSPFYIQPWFIILIAGLSAGILTFIVFRVRMVRQKRKLNEQLQIEQERNRITADLHDDIGSTLSSLQIYSDIAYGVIDKDQEKAKALLNQISIGASKISENIGDIIWSMKGNQVYALSLESRIKNIISETLGPTDIDYEIDIDETADKKIACITCRKNMILIVKEAINNIAKYSNASKVHVGLKHEGKFFILHIKDNGVGMIVEERKFAGNGLSNMQKRMSEIEGKCEILSSPGNGTEIICRFPVTKN